MCAVACIGVMHLHLALDTPASKIILHSNKDIINSGLPLSHRLLGLHRPFIIQTGVSGLYPSNVERCGLTRVQGIFFVPSNASLVVYHKFFVFLDSAKEEFAWETWIRA